MAKLYKVAFAAVPAVRRVPRIAVVCPLLLVSNPPATSVIRPSSDLPVKAMLAVALVLRIARVFIVTVPQVPSAAEPVVMLSVAEGGVVSPLVE